MRQVGKILEVIVTSLHEAIEAECGGADRLELVRALDEEGLTPSLDLVRNVVKAVRIPVRVILRESRGFGVSDCNEMRILQERAGELGDIPIDGIVAGYIKEGRVDLDVMCRVLEYAAHCRVTFHRAFDSVDDPLRALDDLRQIPQVDHVLTGGGPGGWPERAQRLVTWNRAAGPGRTILAGGGIDAGSLGELAKNSSLTEFHVGRAARVPTIPLGSVRRTKVAELKALLA